jgi:two-component system, sensor histidine kinase
MIRFSGKAILQKLGRRHGVRVDPLVQGSIADEQLRMVWSHASIGTLVATAFAVLLALQLRGDIAPTALVDGWLVLKLLVSGVRIHRAHRYRQLGFPGGPGWRRATEGLLALDGAVWGCAGLLLTTASIPMASLMGAVLACVSCVATFGLQISTRATVCYVLPNLAPTALALLLRGDEFGSIGGIGLLMLLGLQVMTARRSERRLVESELLRLRTQALAAEKDEALKLALRQSAVKTQFLANMSHELRTPLHGILGLARLLHLEVNDAAVVRRVELIEASGTHLLSLINDLLDISRIEAGRFAMRSEKFDLITQLDHVAGVYAVRAEDKGLAFAQTTNLARPCWVVGDPARFRQVLHNLLGNAVKFTRAGSVRLTIGREDATDLIVTEVLDTGSGIAPQELDAIFEAFRQSDSAVARPLEGAGLGLAIARDIAQAMGGDISAQSTQGIGTCMRFTASLPITSPADLEPSVQGAALTVDLGKYCQVLIAEDDDVNALIAASFLERAGMQVERVVDGREAVRHALREVSRPDLILMDCRMPTMDGYAATRQIRAQEHTLGLARVPVIALTATAADLDRQQCLDAGMDDFLSKPFTSDELALVVDRWIGPR